jgi:hypothetical protein
MICQNKECENDALYAVQDKIHNLTQIFNFKYLCKEHYEDVK